MAVFTGIDLKRLMDEKGIRAAVLAEQISVEVSTLYKYINGKLRPDPDVMYQICVELGDPSLWNTWMRTVYPSSYGRMHPETMDYPLQGALMSLFVEMNDVAGMQVDALRDGIDGQIDDPVLAERLNKEVTELIQSAQRVRCILQQKKEGGK